jgi:hypothetical protein
MQMSTTLIPVNDIQTMAVAIAKSGLFGMKSPEQAMALMLIAQAEGMHPAIAARDYHVIQGRPALKADAMLARFQAAGGRVEWLRYDDKEVTGKFSHPQGGTATITWTIDQARAAGLASKDVWRQYPRQMLRSRVVSEGVKTIYPGVAVGVYTPEEIQDFDVKPPTVEAKVEAVTTSTPVTVEAVEVSATPPTPTKSEAVAEAPTVQAMPAPESASMKKPFLDRIKKSGWNKEQLTQYSQAAFGKADSKSLSLSEVMQLANTATSQTFEQAMIAGMKAEAPKNGNFDSFRG